MPKRLKSSHNCLITHISHKLLQVACSHFQRLDGGGIVAWWHGGFCIEPSQLGCPGPQAPPCKSACNLIQLINLSVTVSTQSSERPVEGPAGRSLLCFPSLPSPVWFLLRPGHQRVARAPAGSRDTSGQLQVLFLAGASRPELGLVLSTWACLGSLQWCWCAGGAVLKRWGRSGYRTLAGWGRPREGSGPLLPALASHPRPL